ncbi:hypothetical protein VNO77_46222 [Canavalia gladiata]|uniref:Uncharacterized protein n=1 Tax=Canavalia gladiata TaxID=3824 RepID=A0AAN9JGW6_CANGL
MVTLSTHHLYVDVQCKGRPLLFGNAHSVHLLVNLCMSFWAMSRLPSLSLVEINSRDQLLILEIKICYPSLELNPYNGYQLLALWGYSSIFSFLPPNLRMRLVHAEEREDKRMPGFCHRLQANLPRATALPNGPYLADQLVQGFSNFFYICAKPFPLLAYQYILTSTFFLSLALTQIKGLKGQQKKAFFLHWQNAKSSMEKLTTGGDSKISASKEAGDYKSNETASRKEVLIENFALESFSFTHIQLPLKETREGKRRAGNYIEENVDEISQVLGEALFPSTGARDRDADSLASIRFDLTMDLPAFLQRPVTATATA